MKEGNIMRKALIFLAGLLIIAGCAKKQIIKPTIVEQVQAPVSKEEPSVRYTDWTAVPQLAPVHFDYDKFELRESDLYALKQNAQYLVSNPDIIILVEGHCDERGTIAYNLALGQKRAAAVREYYGQLGVALGRIGTISYGSEKPVNPEHTEEAWAYNRRAETKIRNK